jgi:hypothetical protein
MGKVMCQKKKKKKKVFFLTREGTQAAYVILAVENIF